MKKKTIIKVHITRKELDKRLKEFARAIEKDRKLLLNLVREKNEKSKQEVPS